MNANKFPDKAHIANYVAGMLDGWDVNPCTGQFGYKRDELFAAFNEQYGPGNWWFGWKMPNGEVWNFSQAFWNVYVDGYMNYFADEAHQAEAVYLAGNFSYAYDLTEIPEQLAYDPTALVNIPGLPNQFHHVALNIAIAARPGGWRGARPIQVRGPGTEGERWNPGHIPARAEYIEYIDECMSEEYPAWWEPGSIESVYQHRRSFFTRQISQSGEASLE